LSSAPPRSGRVAAGPAGSVDGLVCANANLVVKQMAKIAIHFFMRMSPFRISDFEFLVPMIAANLSFVDIPQYLLSTRRFSKITPLPRSVAYLQMRYREDAKDAKLREEENKS
jgi:hypothetical protein